MHFILQTTAALLLAGGVISCAGNDNNDYIDKSLITPASEKPATQTQASPAGNVAPAAPVIPGINSNMQVTPVNAAQPVTTASGNVNPPHGQPGHRCDIAVGAPLNSKPAPAAQPVTLNKQSPVTITEVPTTVKTAPGMNPPHGEPGHRCDIAVGAPLNSKPAPETAPVKTAAPPELLTPNKPDSTKGLD